MNHPDRLLRAHRPLIIGVDAADENFFADNLPVNVSMEWDESDDNLDGLNIVQALTRTMAKLSGEKSSSPPKM